MFEKELSKLAEFQKRHALLIISSILIITIFFAYYAQRVETDSSFDVMYNDDSKTIQLKKLVSNEFGSTDTLFILVSIDDKSNDIDRIQDIRHPDVLKSMKLLEASIKTETNVYSTTSLVDLLEAIYGRLPQTLEESKDMIESLPKEIKEGPLRSLLSEDRSHLLIAVSINVERKPGSLERIEDTVKSKIDNSPSPIGVKTTLTGMPILLNRIMWFLINDNMSTIMLAVIAVFIILWFYFRSYKIALFSSIPVILTLTWLAGTLYLLDIRITMIIASIGAMMVGMSVDYAIHLTHSYHEKIRKGDEHAAEKTVTDVGAALIASVATTLAGFLAMLLGSSPMALTQGTVLSLGIFYAFFITFIALPPLMFLQRKYIYTGLDEVVFRIRRGEEEKDDRKSSIDRFLSVLASQQVKRPWAVLGFVMLITIISTGGFSLVTMDTEGENWLPEKDDVVDSLFTMGHHFGGTDSQNILFMLKKDAIDDPDSVRDLRDPRVIHKMATLDKSIEQLKWVDKVDSPTNDIRSVNQDKIPQDYESIRRIINDNPQIKQRFSDDYSIAMYQVRFTAAGTGEYYELLREIDSIPFPKEISVTPQGGQAEMEEMDDTLMADTTKTTLIGFILVIAVASVLYTSIVTGLLAFFPIIFAIIWTIGTMGYINLPFTVLTTGMLSMLMGMGIDFSIHLVHGIKNYVKEFGSLEKGVAEALTSTGKAVTITTMTTIAGFLALSFAALVNTQRLGWTLAIGILATFLACMLIVPSVMSIKYKRAAVKNKK